MYSYSYIPALNNYRTRKRIQFCTPNELSQAQFLQSTFLSILYVDTYAVRYQLSLLKNLSDNNIFEHDCEQHSFWDGEHNFGSSGRQLN